MTLACNPELTLLTNMAASSPIVGGTSMALAESCVMIGSEGGKILRCHPRKKNIKKHKVNRYSKILNQDLYGKNSKKYDLIVSNPPYVSKKDFIKLEKNIINFEPRLALISDKNGIYHLEKIILESQKNLKIGGSLIVEVGASQASKVIKIFKKVGFNDIVVSKDLNKIDRIISAKWTK